VKQGVVTAEICVIPAIMRAKIFWCGARNDGPMMSDCVRDGDD
jgi:hypothetical protein